MKKEFESDLETVDNDENAFLVRKSSSRRVCLFLFIFLYKITFFRIMNFFIFNFY